MNLIHDFSPGLFVIQAVILLVLILLMRKFAWKPILDSLQNREEGIQSALDAAENAKKELQNLQADNERVLKLAREEKEALLKEARELKAVILADAKSEAEKESEKIIKQAQETIVSEKRAALADLKNQVAGVSLQIAEELVKSELTNTGKQQELIAALLKENSLN